VTLAATITDKDGDTASASIDLGKQVNFLDDGPVAAIALTQQGVAVDESAGVQANEVAGPLVFAGVANPGTDLPAAQYAQSLGAVVSAAGTVVGADNATTAFSLAIANINSGLTTTDGHPIQLFLENGIVVGRYDSDGVGGITGADNAAFAVAIDATSGVVSTVQYVSLHHNSADGPSPSDISEPVNLGDSINAVVTVTDRDGDVATASTPIGSVVQFLDDGPTASIAPTQATVTVDESTGQQSDDTTNAAVISLFAGVVNPGTDLAATDGAAQYATKTGLVTSAGSSAGADQEGATTVLSLAIVGGNGTDSGLTTTDGHQIFLFKEGDLIVGRYETDGIAGITTTDTAAFAIAIDATTGDVSLAQYVSLHNNTAEVGVPDASEINTLAGKVNAVVTVTDGDGDVATASTGIGDQLHFADDGPSASIAPGATVTVDESTGQQSDDTTNAAVISLFAGVVNPGTDLAATDVAAQYATKAGLVSAGSLAGADQEGATAVISIAITGGDGVDSGLTTTDGHSIFLFKEGDLIVGRYETNGVAGITTADEAAFAIAIDATTGDVSVAQYVSLHHNSADGPSPSDISEFDTLAGKISAVVTVTDGDGDVATSSIDIGGQIHFADDGPVAGIALTANTVSVDETTGIQPPNEVAGPLAVFAGVALPGTDLPAAQYAQSAAAVVNSTGTIGADQENATTVFSLAVASLNSGLTTTDGHQINLFLENGIIVGRYDSNASGTITAADNAAFAVAIDATTGVLSVVQYVSLHHNSPDTPTDISEALNLGNTINAVVTVTDGDGDVSTATTAIGSAVLFLDDGPTLLAKTNLVYANVDNGTGDVGGTGIYLYNIGADDRTTFDSTHSDFAPITLTGTVGSTAITNPTVTWFSESTTSAVFTVAFDYQADPSSSTLTHDTGLLTFDKVAGTYNLVLDQPISSFSTLTTSAGLAFIGYQAGTSTLDNTQPDVMVTELNPNFWVQFTGQETVNGNPSVPLTAGGNTVFTQGETFAADPTWVSVSGSANGVAGDTIQKGEVLTFNFFDANPTGVLTHTDITAASTMFLKFDGYNGEDIVVNLKLVDVGLDGIAGNADDGPTKYLALVVDNTDVFTNGSPPPAGFGIVLDNNDGAIIIQSNDYLPSAGAGNWQIAGAQVITSTEGLSGSGINFNGALGTGATGESTGSEAFSAATVDQDVVKISDIGLITTTTTTQAADLQFNVSNVDADGDTTASTTLDVQITGNTMNGTANADVLQSSAANDTMTGNGGNDIFVLDGHSSATPGVSLSGHDNITDFNAGDLILVDVASQNLTINTSTLAAFTTATDATQATAWNGSANQFVFNTDHNELYYSDNGTAAHALDLAHVATGVPAATAVHTF
jgi:hypothetical protein